MKMYFCQGRRPLDFSKFPKGGCSKIEDLTLKGDTSDDTSVDTNVTADFKGKKHPCAFIRCFCGLQGSLGPLWTSQINRGRRCQDSENIFRKIFFDRDFFFCLENFQNVGFFEKCRIFKMLDFSKNDGFSEKTTRA